MKRYRLYRDSWDFGRLFECKEGEWVKYEEIVKTKHSDDEVESTVQEGKRG